MIFTDHVADDAGRLDVLLVRRVPLLVHRIQDAAVHGLQAVARIGQRTRHDHAHGVIEVGLFISSRMETGRISEGPDGSPGLSSSVSAKGESGQFLAGNHIAYRGSGSPPRPGSGARFFPSFFHRLTGLTAVLRRALFRRLADRSAPSGTQFRGAPQGPADPRASRPGHRLDRFRRR